MSELAGLLTELRSLRLRPADWATIESLVHAVEAGEPGAFDRLRQESFEARVRAKLAHSGRAPAVVASKQISVLPVVGLVCGLFLFGVGYALGGGVVLVGVALLSLFVFGVAFAGSRVAHRGDDDADDEPPPVPIPASVRAVVDRLVGQ